MVNSWLYQRKVHHVVILFINIDKYLRIYLGLFAAMFGEVNS